MIGKGDKLSMRRQCELLGVSRSSVYYQGKGESPQNLRLMRLLDERHLQHPTHGVLQMQDFLCSQGYQANHKRVRRLLRKMDIMAIYPKHNLSKPSQVCKALFTKRIEGMQSQPGMGH